MMTNIQTLPAMNLDLQESSLERARLLKLQKDASVGLDDKKLEKIKKVSRDFEALFVNMMLKSMRSTVSKDELTGGGRAEEMFRSMLDQEYASASTKRGGIGFAKTIEKELIKAESRKISNKVDVVK